jgi:hypothetical protein
MRRVILLLTFLIVLQSCVFVTSFKKFTITRGNEKAFHDREFYSDNFSNTIFFFEDGSCLLITSMNLQDVGIFVDKEKSNIYGKFSDYRSHWGLYQINGDSLEIEFLQKVHQWGFMGICKWKASLNENGEILKVLQGPVNRKIKTTFSTTFQYAGLSLKKTHKLDSFKIDPKKAWINK